MFPILTKDDLYRKAPSVFTRESAVNTSSSYTHISTHEVITALMEKGFMPVLATQSVCRNVDKKPYTKHMLRFRHTDVMATLSGGLFPELVLVNSHDGLSSYRLMAGLYRLVCSNGLVAGQTYGEIRVRHQGNVLGQVIEGTYEVINRAHHMLEATKKMEKIILSESEKLKFAQEAQALRFGVSDENKMFKEEGLLRIRRFEERKDDLFTVFNVVQENLLRGGVGAFTRRPGGRWSRTKTRAISSIDKGLTLNQALWNLAESRAA